MADFEGTFTVCVSGGTVQVTAVPGPSDDWTRAVENEILSALDDALAGNFIGGFQVMEDGTLRRPEPGGDRDPAWAAFCD
jgi:hypothetical protein